MKIIILCYTLRNKLKKVKLLRDFHEIYQYSKDLNILYVEDDEQILESTQHIFENFFKITDTAIDGVDGLEKYKAYKEEKLLFYDLVVTDINMPRKNGIDMIREMRVLNPTQVVIVISAYNDTERLLELIREGISNFITKPIMPNQLMDIIYKTSEGLHSKNMYREYTLQQAKLASMGEMIDTIAHQWLGPINLIKMQAQALEMEIEDGELKKEDIKECADNQALQINHIIATLNEFRSFFRPSGEKEVVLCEDVVHSTLILLKDKLLSHTVNVELNLQDNCKIDVIVNEFKHVLINIITNAIDEFESKDIVNPTITINSFKKDDKVVIEIVDNASGIPQEIIDKIFEQNFTTKLGSGGTGVGLHLVSQILQKIDANIRVDNTKSGARFSIYLKKSYD